MSEVREGVREPDGVPPSCEEGSCVTRVLITGGTGFFGLAVRKYLAGKDVEVVVLSRTEAGSGYLTGSLATIEFPEEPFDYILHMSLEAEGLGRLLEAAKRWGVRNLLVTSSGAVVETPFTEYAVQKRRQEFELLESGVACNIARC